MSRLIDADVLFDELLKRQYSAQSMGIFHTEYPHMMGIVAKQPTIDPESLRPHGRWVWDENAMDWGLGGWICSECQERNDNIPAKPDIHPSGWVGSHFCPNCGAKMDEEEEMTIDQD